MPDDVYRLNYSELLNRYGFCEVSRLIHITTARERSMVREKLQVRQHRENIENVLFIRHVRQFCVRLHSVNGRENISRRSSCLDLSEIHHGFVGEFAVGYNRDDRRSVFDTCSRMTEVSLSHSSRDILPPRYAR